MGVREYLDQREQELLEEIGRCWREIERQYNTIVPLEGELAEVRRAKTAVNAGPGIVGTPSGIGLNSLLSSGTGISSLFGLGSAAPPSLLSLPGDGDSTPGGLLGSAFASPYERLTMKELVVKALSEHFPNGATTRQLLNFFRDAWGRNIERTNLSPQLSRLFAASQITQFGDRPEWHLLPPRPLGNGEVHPYRNTATGEIWWMASDRLLANDVVPGKIRETSRPDFES